MSDNQQIATRQPSALGQLRRDIDTMTQQFQFALPAHIPVERFKRIVITAVQNNPKLLRCTRQSFFNACMKAAQDGLLPDNREGAIVPYSDEGSDQAQWLPMIRGIRKLVRNAKILSDWNVQVVQEGDQFDYQLGDDPHILHKPAPLGGRTRKVLFAYSIATYPDGTKSREVMNADQLKDVQSKSKAKKGPWSDPIFFPEMCRKTVAKLHAKQLPMSTDLDTVLRRDDELYDLKGASDRERPKDERQRPPSIIAALDSFADAADDDDENKERREPSGTPAAEPAARVEESTTTAQAPGDAAQATQEVPPADSTQAQTAGATPDGAYRRGLDAYRAGMSIKAVPPEWRGQDASSTALAAAWIKGFHFAEANDPKKAK